MRLIDIYRARYDGRTREALRAATENLQQLQHEQSNRWWDMWTALMCLKGDCYLDLGQYEQAEACFGEVFAKTNNSVALGNRGYAREKMGMLDAAKDDYVKALALPTDEEDKEVRLTNLVDLCLQRGELEEASTYLEQARQIAGDSFDIMDLKKEIDRAYEKRKRTDL